MSRVQFAIPISMTSSSHRYAIGENVLRKWVTQRLRAQPRSNGGAHYSFTLSGSTCNGRPVEVVMNVALDADGIIQSATAHPAANDSCDRMCAAHGDGCDFLADVGSCEEVTGLSLRDAAFRNWDEEPSGCFCTAGNRRHKWRNVFQALHYAVTHGGIAHR